MFDWHSALASRLAAGGRDAVDGRRTLGIEEVRGWHLAQLAVFAGHETAFNESLQPLLHADLPAAVGTQIAVHGAPAAARGRIYHTARRQYWVLATDPAWLGRLLCAVPPTVGTATLLTHSRVRIAVRGTSVRALLGKGIALDLDPAAFPVGRFAHTGLHHCSVLLERCGEDHYELYLPRTFAASLWDWLIDAALPLGYDVALADDMPPTDDVPPHGPRSA